MKAVTATLVLALTMIATTSHAFCLKAYMESLKGNSSLRDSVSTNFVPQGQAARVSESNSAPVIIKK